MAAGMKRKLEDAREMCQKFIAKHPAVTGPVLVSFAKKNKGASSNQPVQKSFPESEEDYEHLQPRSSFLCQRSGRKDWRTGICCVTVPLGTGI